MKVREVSLGFTYRVLHSRDVLGSFPTTFSKLKEDWYCTKCIGYTITDNEAVLYWIYSRSMFTLPDQILIKQVCTNLAAEEQQDAGKYTRFIIIGDISSLCNFTFADGVFSYHKRDNPITNTYTFEQLVASASLVTDATKYIPEIKNLIRYFYTNASINIRA
jgi:hypothetical protein